MNSSTCPVESACPSWCVTCCHSKSHKMSQKKMERSLQRPSNGAGTRLDQTPGVQLIQCRTLFWHKMDGSYGGFHKWRYLNSWMVKWMVYKRKTISKWVCIVENLIEMDDFGAPPLKWKPLWHALQVLFQTFPQILIARRPYAFQHQNHWPLVSLEPKPNSQQDTNDSNEGRWLWWLMVMMVMMVDGYQQF